MNDLQKSLYKVNSAMLAGKGNAQGVFTFALVDRDMFTLSLVDPADAPRFLHLVYVS